MKIKRRLAAPVNATPTALTGKSCMCRAISTAGTNYYKECINYGNL